MNNPTLASLIMAGLLAQGAAAQEPSNWHHKLNETFEDMGRVVQEKAADVADYVADGALKLKLETQIEERVAPEHCTPSLDAFLQSYDKRISQDADVTALDERKGEVRATVTTNLGYEGFSLARPYVFSLNSENNIAEEVNRGEVTGTIYGKTVDGKTVLQVLSLDQIATEKWSAIRSTHERDHPGETLAFQIASRSCEGNVYQDDSDEGAVPNQQVYRSPYDGAVTMVYCIRDSTGNPLNNTRIEEGYGLKGIFGGKHWEFSGEISRGEMPLPRNTVNEIKKGVTETYEKARDAIEKHR